MARWKSSVRALATHGRVVHAIMLREIKSRFGRQKLGYLWAVLEPATFTAFFALIFAFGHQAAPSGMPVVPFMITGFAPFILFRSTMTQSLGAIETNRILLTFPQVTPTDLVLARALLEIATMVVVLFFLLGFAHVIGFDVAIENPLGMLAALGCLATMGFGLGAFFSALAPFVRSMPLIVSIIAGRPLFFVSGLFFTAEMLPGKFRDILLLNPVLHMIEWLRSAVFAGFESRYVDMGYATGAALFALFFGLLTLRGLNKRILAAV